MPNPKLIAQGGYATGDQFAIAAMLQHDTTAHVVISTCDNPPGADKSAETLRFYEECGIDPTRVHTVPVGYAYDKDALQAAAQKMADDGIMVNGENQKFQRVNIGAGTQYIQDTWAADPSLKTTIRSGWGVDDAHRNDAQVRDWLSTQGVQPEDIQGKKVAVLWSRFSGKGGGAHPEHDTSHAGMTQMVDGLKAKGFDTILIVGDRHPFQPKGGAPGAKDTYGDLARANPGGEGNPGKVVDLTEFWKGNPDEKAALKRWQGEQLPRAGQFKLYDHLQSQSGGLIHIGTRSGNLEAMALMGHQVGYLEQKHSKGGPRMDKWENVQGLGYQKILLDEVPTRTGKHLTTDSVTGVLHNHGDAYRQHDVPGLTKSKLPSKDERIPIADRREDHAWKKNARIGDYDKGFTPADLRAITGFATASVTQQQLNKLPPPLPGYDAGNPVHVTGRLQALEHKAALQTGLVQSLQQQRDVLADKIQTLTQQRADRPHSVQQAVIGKQRIDRHHQDIRDLQNELHRESNALWKAETNADNLHARLHPARGNAPRGREKDRLQGYLDQAEDKIQGHKARIDAIKADLTTARQALQADIATYQPHIQATRQGRIEARDIDNILAKQRTSLQRVDQKLAQAGQALTQTLQQQQATAQDLARLQAPPEVKNEAPDLNLDPPLSPRIGSVEAEGGIQYQRKSRAPAPEGQALGGKMRDVHQPAVSPEKKEEPKVSWAAVVGSRK